MLPWRGGRSLHNRLREVFGAGLDLALASSWLGDGASGGRLGAFLNGLFSRLAELITSMARASVDISTLAPELAQMAREGEESSQDQERRSQEISQASRELSERVGSIGEATRAADQLSGQVAKVTAELDRRMTEAGEILALIRRVARQTTLLSLNAAVEAARAGEQGAGFAVLADEIRALARRTDSATGEVGRILGGLGGDVQRLVSAMGGAGNGDQAGQATLPALVREIAEAAAEQQTRVERIADDVAAVAAAARQHHDTSRRVNELSGLLRGRSESLLMDLGRFRLASHHSARRVLEDLAARPEVQALDRGPVERVLAASLEANPMFELLYATDAAGRQFVGNVGRSGLDSSVVGADWSRRPWFQGVMERRDTHTSDIYRSVATDDFCFTAATPIRGPDGWIIGVLAADVQFSELLRE